MLFRCITPMEEIPGSSIEVIATLPPTSAMHRRQCADPMSALHSSILQLCSGVPLLLSSFLQLTSLLSRNRGRPRLQHLHGLAQAVGIHDSLLRAPTIPLTPSSRPWSSVPAVIPLNGSA